MTRHPSRSIPTPAVPLPAARFRAPKFAALLPGMATLLLSGCAGMGNYASSVLDPFGTPNTPPGNSINMQRALGNQVAVQPILPQPGDVWPGKLQPVPTLSEIQKHMGTPLGQVYEERARQQTGNAAATYSVPPGGKAERLPPTHEAAPKAAPGVSFTPPPAKPTHSSTPPGGGQNPVVSRPEVAAPAPSRAQPLHDDTGFAVGQTLVGPSGPAGVVTSAGNGRYQTVAPIAGKGGGILIPNGNGTATLIQPNGTVVTVQAQ